MTLPQVTSWAFLAVIAVMFNSLMQPPGAVPATPADASAAAGQRAARPDAVVPRALIVPVAQADPAALADTWGQARSEGRAHQGIDILAARGTPVLAAVDGRIAKFFSSERGGQTIYQFDADQRYVYYYAHLDRRADGLAEGAVVRQGDVIGFVGQTGNAPVPHLHFEIQRLTPARHWWEAEPLNPYPYLVAGRPPA